MDRLYVAAKAPRAGFVKTRLAKRVGDVAAAELYRAFLSDLSARLRGLPISTGWFVTPDEAWQEVSAVVGAGWSDPVPQGDGEWGTRQDRLFRTTPDRDEQRVVLIASDSPQVGLAQVTEAFDALDSHDVVLGPVLDGGYWLIGMRTHVELLGAVPMSTSCVLVEILAEARRAGLSVHLLEPQFDVDEVSDLADLEAAVRSHGDMPATGAVLASLERAGTVAAVSA